MEGGMGEVSLAEGQSFEEQQRGIQWRLMQGPEADDYSQLLLEDIAACLPPVSKPSSSAPLPLPLPLPNPNPALISPFCQY